MSTLVGEFINCPACGKEIRIECVNEPYWEQQIASLRQQLADAERERDAVLERGELVLVWMARVLQERNELVAENATLRQQMEAAITLLREHRGMAAFAGCGRNRMKIADFLDALSVRGERKPEAIEKTIASLQGVGAGKPETIWEYPCGCIRFSFPEEPEKGYSHSSCKAHVGKFGEESHE
jgi:hypothetical protein